MEIVARHELGLRERIAEAAQQAETILAEARRTAENARAHARERLAEELRRIREQTEREGDALRREILDEAEAEANRARMDAAIHEREILDTVMKLILPDDAEPGP